MVKVVLRPLYAEQKIDKDQYTDINRSVSRMLYDKVSEHKSGLEDERHRREWQRIAQDEVERAVEDLIKQEVVVEKKEEDVKVDPESVPVHQEEEDGVLDGVLDGVAAEQRVEIKQEA